MLLWVLGGLLLLFSSLDVWYFVRVVLVLLQAWLQGPMWDVLAEHRVSGRVLLADVKLYQMTSARYLRECDLARTALCTRNGIFKAMQALGATMSTGVSTVLCRRPLALFEAFELRSRIVAWDNSSFFLEQRFISHADGFVCAVGLCSQDVQGSSPDKILQFLCKRKVECLEYPHDLQNWLSFIRTSNQTLRAEGSMEKKSK